MFSFRELGGHLGAASLAGIVPGVRFAEGDRAAVFYDLVTNTSRYVGRGVVHRRNGQMTDARATFDARPFAAMFGKQ